MLRRTFLFTLAAAPLVARAAPPAGMKGIEELQNNWKSLLPAGASVPSPSEPLKLSKGEWKKRLPAQAYKVLRDEGTEPAGSSPLNGEKRPGVFACAEHKFLRRLESEMRDGYLDGRIKRDNYLSVRTKRANHLKEQAK